MATPQFGKYELLKKIAVGGMAEIYLARQTGLVGFEKLVVVKIILPHLATEERFVRMFLDEARLAATLNHPHVVQVYDLGREQESYYIAMEFIAGQDLNALVKGAKKLGQQIPIEVACRIIANAAEGLHYAHTLKDRQGKPINLVHRDVSPSNILVSYEGGVKLVDFGIAKAESQTSKTQAGTLKGKYSYMSPEQARGLPLDARSDLFALGIVLYEVLVGRRLFRRESEFAIINDIVEGVVPKPSKLRPDLPSALDDICERALEKDVRARFQTAQEFQLALDRFLGKLPNPTTSIDVANFMSVTFAEEHAVYERLLAELPTASQEQLQQMLQDSMGVEPKAGTGSSFSGSVPKIMLHPETEAGDVELKRRKKPPAALLGALAATAAVLLALAVWFGLRSGAGPATEIGVSSVPAGARIFVDGKDTGLMTPAKVVGVGLGEHQVRLENSGHETKVTTVVLTAEAPSNLVAVDMPAKQVPAGTLEVLTTPAGADVFLDGRPLGKSPVVVKDVEASVEHLVRVSLAGHVDDAVPVKVEADTQQQVKFSLKPKGGAEVARTGAEATDKPDKPDKPGKPSAKTFTVQISSDPAAELSVDGKSRGRTPLTLKLPPGPHRLQFTDPANQLNVSASLNVAKDGGEAFKFAKGKLAFNVEPWAHVYLLGKRVGTTPMKPLELYEGDYKVRLWNDETGKEREKVVHVKPNKTEVVKESLE